MVTLYGIKNCDTIKKARRWLEANNIDYRFHDYRVDGLVQLSNVHCSARLVSLCCWVSVNPVISNFSMRCSLCRARLLS